MPTGAVGPGADHTGGGSVWATNLAGNAKACEDSTLTSPVIDLSTVAGQAVQLRFWHWADFRGCTPGGLCPAFVCNLDNSSYSGGVLEVKTTGNNWTTLTPTSGYGNGSQKISCSGTDAACTSCSLEGKAGFGGASPQKVWVQSTYDVSAYANATFEFRLRFASHDTGYSCYPNEAGWYIDDIEIGTQNVCP